MSFMSIEYSPPLLIKLPQKSYCMWINMGLTTTACSVSILATAMYVVTLSMQLFSVVPLISTSMPSPHIPSPVPSRPQRVRCVPA